MESFLKAHPDNEIHSFTFWSNYWKCLDWQIFLHIFFCLCSCFWVLLDICVFLLCHTIVRRYFLCRFVHQKHQHCISASNNSSLGASIYNSVFVFKLICMYLSWGLYNILSTDLLSMWLHRLISYFFFLASFVAIFHLITFLYSVFYLYPFHWSFQFSTLPGQLSYALLCIYFSSTILSYHFIILCLGLRVPRSLHVCLYNPKNQ